MRQRRLVLDATDLSPLEYEALHKRLVSAIEDYDLDEKCTLIAEKVVEDGDNEPIAKDCRNVTEDWL